MFWISDVCSRLALADDLRNVRNADGRPRQPRDGNSTLVNRLPGSRVRHVDGDDGGNDAALGRADDLAARAHRSRANVRATISANFALLEIGQAPGRERVCT